MKKIKYLSMLLLFIIFVFGVRVNAKELKVEIQDNIWIFRKGGGKKAYSGPYKLFSIDNKTTYCIEPGENITTNDYVETNDTLLNDALEKEIRLIGYYGYDYPGHNTIKYRMATQALIWEKISGQTVEYWTEPSGAGTFINISLERNEIMSLVNSHKYINFNNNYLETTINNKVSFIDENNVLDQYDVIESDSFSYNKNDNILEIIPKKVGLTEILLKRNTYANDLTTYYVGRDVESQMMGYFGSSNEDIYTLKVKAIGGNITIKKVDSYTFTSTPMCDGKIEGAIYAVYDESESKVDEIIIPKSGIGVSKNLPIGKYTVKEIKAGEGYRISDNIYSFEIKENDLYPKKTVYEFIISPIIRFVKILNDQKTGIMTPEEGVIFEFYLNSSGKLISRITTDKYGYATVVLPYGEYTVKQVNTKEGYEKIDDFLFTIKDDIEMVKVISDGVIDGYKLKVNKIDSETKKLININGIKFKIKNIDKNEYVCQKVNYPNTMEICEYEINNGTFITPEILPFGNYEIEELPGNLGNYYLNKDKLSFSIDLNNYKYDDNIGNYIELNFENNPVKGELEIEKSFEYMYIDGEKYIYKNDLKKDAYFNLYAKDDIYSNDGEKVYEKDELIKEIELNNGYAKINNLYLGSYYLKEICTLNNYYCDEYIDFEFKYKDQYTPIINVKKEVINKIKKGKFIFQKVDKNGNPLSGANIEIYNDNNEKIYTGLTDKNGYIKIDNLAFGKYKYIEANAPLGYIKDKNEYYFELKDSENEVIIEAENEQITGSFKLVKENENGERLQDAEIKIYDVNTSKLIYSGLTDKNGEIYLDSLPYGNYKYVETKSPDGYDVDNKEYFFDIVNDGDNISVSIVNQKSKGITYYYEDVNINDIVFVPNTYSSKINYLKYLKILLFGLGIFVYHENKKINC